MALSNKGKRFSNDLLFTLKKHQRSYFKKMILLLYISNLHFLPIELYKVVNDQTTKKNSDIFLHNNRGICFRSQNDFALTE